MDLVTRCYYIGIALFEREKIIFFEFLIALRDMYIHTFVSMFRGCACVFAL